MHTSLSRRNFLTLSAGAGALASGLFPALASACPVLDPPDPLKGAKALAAGINEFASDLHARLARDTTGDLFFSPFSIEAALAMTAAGARGKTLDEMEKVLHLPKDPHPAFGALLRHLNQPGLVLAAETPAAPSGPFPWLGLDYQLTVANAIWAQKGFPWSKEFADLTRKHYGAGLVPVNFAESDAARERINAWAEQETRGKIKNLVPEGVLDPLTRMVLANAIHFKGTWLTRFDEKRTKNAAFTRDDGTAAEVPLMELTATLNYGETRLGGRGGLDVQVLELPYAGKELSMLVVLPEKDRGVNRLAARLNGQSLSGPALKPTEVSVSLPRFKVESELSLKPALTGLGMKAAFGDADFTGMAPRGHDLHISHVLHKAFVEVNEEGTEAAAATAVVVRERVRPQPKELRADRPFVFAICDNGTGTVLFLGRYTGPAK